MKVLLIDHYMGALGFALRLVQAGHAVRWFIKPDPTYSKQIGDGFKGIEKVDNWLPSAKWADLIWCSGNSDYMPKLDMLRQAGLKVFGPSAASAALEIKRALGMKFFEQAGIEVPAYKQFTSLNEAEAHVRKTGGRFVFKTLGDNEDKSLSYVAKDPADMIARIQYWKMLKMNPKGPVMLQEFIEGSEFAVSAWMGSKGFIGKPNDNFEHKKLMSGDCGPNCGESGTVMKYCDSSKLADAVLYPLEKKLIELGHLGAIDVNCIVDTKGKAWPLEFTARTGWPAFNIMMAAHKGDPAKWMLDACKGEDTLEVSPQVSCGIVVAQPDYPYNNNKPVEMEGVPVYGVTPKNKMYVIAQDLKWAKQPVMDGEKLTEKEMWTTAGTYIAVVTGLGKTIKKACERAYSTLHEIYVPNMIYRDDIGEKLEKELPKLQAHGFATEFSYS